MTNERLRNKCARTTGCLLLAGTVLCAAPFAAAQIPMPMPIMTDPASKDANAGGRVPEFDVTSVKENKSDGHMMRMMTKPDGLSMTNLPLKSLIANAYGIKQDLISGGAGWIDSTGFDVETKVAGQDVADYKKLSSLQRRLMMQAFLADRFKLKAHLETKELPVYELMVVKGGPKLPASAVPPFDPDAPRGPDAKYVGPRMMMGRGTFTGDGVDIAALASQVSYTVHRTVVDKTGLKGRYDVKLEWTPDDGPARNEVSGETGPSIFTALQEQLGLKLQPAKGPVETLVIDHAELPAQD